MYLQSLENYIVELSVDRVNSTTTVFLDADEVIRDLIHILLEEEAHIPDFVVNDGKHVPEDAYLDDYRGFFDSYDDGECCYLDGDLIEDVSSVEVNVKRFLWLCVTIGVGLVGFLTGFFSAP